MRVSATSGAVYKRLTSEQKATWPPEKDRRELLQGTVERKSDKNKHWVVNVDTVGKVTLQRNTLTIVSNTSESPSASIDEAGPTLVPDPPRSSEAAATDAGECATPPPRTAAAAVKSFKLLSREQQLAARTVEIPSNKDGEVFEWHVLPEGEEITEDERVNHEQEQRRQLEKLAQTIGPDRDLGDAFFETCFPDLDGVSQKFNKFLQRFKKTTPKEKPIRFTDDDIRTCCLLLLAGTEEAEDGTQNLFSSKKHGRSEPPDFQKYIPRERFKAFLSALPFVWTDEDSWPFFHRNQAQWTHFQPVLDQFNLRRLSVGDGEVWKVWTICIDESMSAWCPKTSKTGGLPNITYEPRKPAPLGKFMPPRCKESAC